MKNSYSKSSSKNQKVVSSLNKPSEKIGTYKYALIKLPLIQKHTLGKSKSPSSYSTQHSKRLKYQSKQNHIPQKPSKQIKQISPHDFVTDRDESQTRNTPVKQQKLLITQASNQSQYSNFRFKNNINTHNSHNRSAAKSIDDHNVGSLESSTNTVNSQPVMINKTKLIEFQNIGFNMKLAIKDLGESHSLRTTDLLDNFQNHVKRYGTEHIKLVPLSKTQSNQLEIAKQQERIKLFRRLTQKSLQKYIGYKKYQIEHIVNEKLLNQALEYRQLTNKRYY